jgi:hypothetical protein
MICVFVCQLCYTISIYLFRPYIDPTSGQLYLVYYHVISRHTQNDLTTQGVYDRAWRYYAHYYY